MEFCRYCNNLMVEFMSQIKLNHHGIPGSPRRPFCPSVGLFSIALASFQNFSSFLKSTFLPYDIICLKNSYLHPNTIFLLNYNIVAVLPSIFRKSVVYMKFSYKLHPLVICNTVQSLHLLTSVYIFLNMNESIYISIEYNSWIDYLVDN